MEQINSSMIQVKGIIKGKIYSQDNLTLSQRIMNKIIMKSRGTDLFDRISKYFTFGDLVKEDIQENVVCLPGLRVLAMRNCGDYTYTGKIDTALLGTGVGVPVWTDTGLFNEVYRNPIASYSFSDNKAILTAWFDVGEVGGDFKEFGTMIDNSLLWTHVSVDWSKLPEQVLVVSAEYDYIPKTT